MKDMEVTCPRCGRKVTLEPCLDKPGRIEGRCVCNPFGPVIETDQVFQEDMKHDSTKH